MATDTGSNALSFDRMLAKDARDHVRHVVELHNLPIDNRVRLQVLVAEAHEVNYAALLLQLDRLNGTRTDVETDQIFLYLFEHGLFIPRKGQRADSLAAQTR